MLAKRGQQVRDHLEAGRRDGFEGHPEFEQAQRAVLGEVQAQVGRAEVWLEKVRNDLYTAEVAVQRTRAVDRRQGSEEQETVPVRVPPAAQPPSRPGRRTLREHRCSQVWSGWRIPSPTLG
jgi:hypothetical protein